MWRHNASVCWDGSNLYNVGFVGMTFIYIIYSLNDLYVHVLSIIKKIKFFNIDSDEITK